MGPGELEINSQIISKTLPIIWIDPNYVYIYIGDITKPDFPRHRNIIYAYDS